MNHNTTDNHETAYRGMLTGGFAMLGVIIVLIALAGWTFTTDSPAAVIAGGIAIAAAIICMCGFMTLEPNEAMVMLFFGKYQGTVRRVGFSWANPFMTKRKISLRIRNLDVEPIKVNDRTGNPILIGLVLVWRVTDTYRAVFDVDNGAGKYGAVLSNFVAIQSDAALREVAGRYAYDNTGTHNDELPLRDGGEQVNDELEHKLNERLAMAGIEVVEARINYLAYAPEIAAVMLRRQQASAIVSAREQIVEGAVGMVRLALESLERDNVVELTMERKAAMVSNLMVVLCSDDAATPIVNAGE